MSCVCVCEATMPWAHGAEVVVTYGALKMTPAVGRDLLSGTRARERERLTMCTTCVWRLEWMNRDEPEGECDW